MKKLIILLSVVFILGLGILTYYDTEAQMSRRNTTKGAIYLTSHISKNKEVTSLLEYVSSVESKNDKPDEGNAYANRTGTLAEINLSSTNPLPKHKEIIEKIERVLALDGLTDYVYALDEGYYKDLFTSEEKNNKPVVQYKVYEDVLVSITNTELTVGEYGEDLSSPQYQRDVKVLIAKDDVLHKDYTQLIKELKTPLYYLTNIFTGGQKDMLTFSNAQSLLSLQDESRLLDEYGNLLENKGSSVKYEVYIQDARVDKVRLILTDTVTPNLTNEDLAMLQKVVTKLGLNTLEIDELENLLADTLANPMKNKTSTIGTWTYSATYAQQSLSNRKLTYLDIVLK